MSARAAGTLSAARFLLAAAAKDLRRRRRDPWAPLMWLLVPVTIGALITLISSGGGGSPTAKLLVVDQDGSFSSGLVSAAFEQGPLADLVEVEQVSPSDGQARIERGAASALLVIPAGFAEALLADTPLTLELVTNPSQSVLPAIVQQGLEVLLDGVFYLQRAIGDELRASGTGADAGELAATLAEAVQAAAGSLLPPLLLVESATAAGDTPAPGFALLFFPGVLFMALLLTAQGLAADLWTERRSGALRRLATTARGTSVLLGGKLLAGAALIAGIGLLMSTAGFAWHGLPASKLPVVLGWLVLSGTVLSLLFAAIVLTAPTQQAAQLLGNLLGFPLMMVGGSFFPFEAMPDWLAAVGRFTPNGLMLVQLKAYLLGPFDPAGMARVLAILVAAGALLFAVCARLLRGRTGVAG